VTYMDGTCDVGLWCRERLIKLCTSVSTAAFSVHSRGFCCNHDDHRKRIPKAVHVRSRLESATRSAVSLCRSPEPMSCGFESDLEDIAKAVVSDLLPVTSLAADLRSYDEAFFTCSQSSFHSVPNLGCASSSSGRHCRTVVAPVGAVDDGVDANLTLSRSEFVKSVMAVPTSVQDLHQEVEDVLAWNNTASCIAMQVNVLRHRSAQSAVGFIVDLIVAGERGSTMPARGIIELTSERFILAADAGDLATVSQLLINGDVNVDVSDSAGHTALFAAAVTFNLCVV